MSFSTVTSESLQKKLRELLPSQQGFATDISASDTIIPIIDLTEAAEGSTVGQNLQTAIAFGSQTAFTGTTGGVTVANTPGFYRLTATMGVYSGTSCSLEMTDGATTKVVYKLEHVAGGTVLSYCVPYDFVFFLRAGDTLTAKISSANAFHLGSSRQIADVSGTLVNPVGFTPS